MNASTLESISLAAVYSAMFVYALAFVFFAYDLARRMSLSSRSDLAQMRLASAMAVQSSGSGPDASAHLDADRAEATRDRMTPRDRHGAVRAGMALATIGWLFQVVGTVLRGIDAHRVPWENMYEFTLTSTAIIVGVFIAVQIQIDVRFVGTYILGFVLTMLGLAATNYYVPVVPTPPTLQSAWLVIHVFVASLGTGFLGLGAAVATMQIIQARRVTRGLRAIRSIPGDERLESISYRLNIMGFVLWTFTLAAGAIWADSAWGRYWGWDTKEVWTFIVWVIYAGYIHSRSTRGWRGSRSAGLALVGFAAVLFNFTIVNIFFHGMHSYAGFTTPAS